MSRARPHAELLFNRMPFFSVQEGHRQEMLAAIDGEDPALLQASNVDALVVDIVDRFSLEAPTLLPGAVSVTLDEMTIDVPANFYNGFMAGSVQGIRAVYYVPFEGNQQLFHCTPSTRNLSLRPVELRQHELMFAYERPDQNVGDTKKEFDGELRQIQESLAWLANDCQRFNASLPAQAHERIMQRQQRLATMSAGIQGLGIPIRRSGTRTSAATSRVEAPARPSRETADTETYDVALSFAGEERSYVEQVAQGLQDAGVKVFYDAFETASLWGKNLIDHLAKIYSKRARYVVMFISEAYVNKAWTTHERQHAQERALLAQEEYILPARFDDTPVPGMTNTVKYQDLRKITPVQLVNLIRQKLDK